MDIQNTIETRVKIDTTEAQKDIAKLNSKASDSTQTLEDRIEAKNKAVKIQNDLSKTTIKNLEKEVKKLKDEDASIKQVNAATKRLNTAKIKAAKLNANGIKQQNKLNKSLADSKDKMKNLDGATGGVISKFKAFISNPIGLTIAAIAGAFNLLKQAVSRSGKASETFSKIGTKLTGFFNGLLAVLEPVVEFIGEKLLQALNDPMQSIKDLGNSIKENIINRFEALTILGDAIVKLFKGDFDGAFDSAKEGFLQLATGIEDVEEKTKAFIKSSTESFNKAAEATNQLANAEKRLLANKIELEKTQLTAQRLAEEQRQIRDDESRSMEERIAANEKLGQILDTQAKKELEVAQQSLDIANNKLIAEGQTIENLQAVGDAEVKMAEIRERITSQQSEQLTNINSLKREQQKLNEQAQENLTNEELLNQERAKRDIDAQIEIDELKYQQKISAGERDLEYEKELLDRKMKQELANEELTAKEKELIREQYKEAKEKIDKTSKEIEIKTVDAAAEHGIESMAESFGVAKELGVAKAIMAAPEAVSQSFKMASATYPFPLSMAMGAAGAAGTIVPIIKGLSDIKKTRFSKSSKKGGSRSSSGSISSAVTAPSGVQTSALTNLSQVNANRSGADSDIMNQSTMSAAASVGGTQSQNIVFSESKYQNFQEQVNFKESKVNI